MSIQKSEFGHSLLPSLLYMYWCKQAHAAASKVMQTMLCS
jgi:hypothetical protein